MYLYLDSPMFYSAEKHVEGLFYILVDIDAVTTSLIQTFSYLFKKRILKNYFLSKTDEVHSYCKILSIATFLPFFSVNTFI